MAGIRADVNLNVNTSDVKRSLDRATNEINKIVGGISGKPIGFNVNQKSFTQPLGRITQSANEFTKSLEASNARVIAFGLSVSIINGISDAFKALVVEAVRFEKTMADINAVMGISNERLAKFGEGIFDVAQNTAQSFNVAAEAALEFSRQGLQTEEVLRRTNDALILTRLTSLDAASAVSGLTAAVNAFGKAGLTTTDIIDKLAAVDVSFAVSSEDLINALQRSGAVAIDAGVELDSLIGIVAALQQTTARGGAVIGNSLKTIFTRIQRPESIRQIEELGIVVRDLSGAILPADKILLNMAKSFDALTQAQQSNVVQFSAGIFQANVFRAALADLAKDQSLQAQATEISAQASGEAAAKNQLLNKTLSALTSQAGTGIKELTAILGQMSLGPGIGNALEFINERVEELKNSLGGGEEEGSDFAKGLVKGIGNVLTGPAAIAFGAIFIKMFMNIAKFASSSIKDVLGVVSQKDKIKQMEESILQALSRNLNIQQSLNNLEGDRVAQEKFMLGIIEAQTAAMKEQQALARSLAKPLVRKGIDPTMLGAAGGMIPESSKSQERQGARKGGYSPGAIDSMNVPGIGKVVYNKAETVKQFPGMKQPAIMPPESSKAGGVYKATFKERHGFDPYASHGFVPNFAMKRGSTLVMDKAKLKVFGTDMDIGKAVKKKYQEIQEHFEAKLPITIEAGLEQIITSSTKSKKQPTGKESLFESFSALSGIGIKSIERPFDIRNIASAKSRGAKQGKLTGAEFAEKKVMNVLKREQNLDKASKEGEYRLTHDPETNKGLPDYPVDIIAYGENYPTYEVKSGSFNPANLIFKSLRMASDRELPNWMQQNKISGGKKLQERKLKKAETLSKKLDLYDPKQKKSAREEGFEFSQDFADEWGLSQGFVPNFSVQAGEERQAIYNLLASTWRSKGVRLTNKEIEDLTGISFDEFKGSAYKRAGGKAGDFEKKYGSQITSKGYVLSARPKSGVNDYSQAIKEKIKTFIEKFEAKDRMGMGLGYTAISDGQLMNQFIKQKEFHSAAGHSFESVKEEGSRTLGTDITKYRTQIATLGLSTKSNWDKSMAQTAAKSSNWSLKKGSTGTLNRKASGKQISSTFPGVIQGAPQSFLGLKNRSRIPQLTKKEIKNFIGSEFQVNSQGYGIHDGIGFLGYNTLRGINGMSAFDFEEAIEDISGGVYKQGTSEAPLDYVGRGALGEAKFGPTAFKGTTDVHLVGKILRHMIGSGLIQWPLLQKGSYSLGDLSYFHTEHPASPHTKERNKKAHILGGKSQGLIPNFASFRSPLRFDIGGEKSNGRSYVARTAKSGKLFLLESGLNSFKKYMKDQGKPAPTMSRGSMGKRDGYWVNQYESDILEWAKQPNPQILERDANERKAREESQQNFREELKHGTFKSLEAGYPLNLGGGESVGYSPVSGFGKTIVDKMGPEYKHISVNVKKIQDYARDNDITKKFNFGPAPDYQKALNTMLELPKADIKKLDFIRPREKSEKEKKIELRDSSPKSPIKWDVKQDMLTKKKQYGIKASNETFSYFKKFLEKKGVPSRSIQNIDKALQGKSDKLKEMQQEAVRKSQSRSGRQMFYDAAVQAENFEKSFSIPTDNLYIKNLSNLIKEFNSTVYKEFSDGLIPDYSPVEMNKGYVPNFANLIYDKDKIKSGLDSQVLKEILSERKRKDLLIGPSGVGKSTLAAQYGEFIKGIEDTEKATSYTILSGAGKTKAGGISPALQEIINSVNQSGGKVSYLSASDQVIDERRKKRIETPVAGDLRSEKQLKGTRFAPKNQPGLTEIIQKASKRFEIIKAAEGFVPNFAFKNEPIRLDGGFGRKGRIIQDTDTGSFMTYTTNEIGDREIDFLRSNKKGDAYKIFKREGEGRFMQKGGAYTSPTIKQQRSFKQGSKTNFEDLIYAFPQLRYRMQPNMTTTGRMIHGPEGKRFRFDSIDNLQDISNKLDRQSFRNALGSFPGVPGMDVISIQDLITVVNKQGMHKQAASGLMPNQKSESSIKRRPLDLGWLSPSPGKGANEIRQIFKNIAAAAKSGQPYTDLKAGFVVGPRIPRLLIEGQKLLDRSRSAGKNIPKMKISGSFTPAKLMRNIYENKQRSDEGHVFASKMDYKEGEEHEVAQYLRKMGLSPSSKEIVELEDLPIFKKGFSQGLVPNFANPLADAVKREKDAGIPSSRIRIEKSSQLKSPQNPMGLAVTNTRDEPAGLQQGI